MVSGCSNKVTIKITIPDILAHNTSLLAETVLTFSNIASSYTICRATKGQEPGERVHAGQLQRAATTTASLMAETNGWHSAQACTHEHTSADTHNTCLIPASAPASCSGFSLFQRLLRIIVLLWNFCVCGKQTENLDIEMWGVKWKESEGVCLSAGLHAPWAVENMPTGISGADFGPLKFLFSTISSSCLYVTMKLHSMITAKYD